MNYYNEIDLKAAAWLRELIDNGLIPRGEVDERSITEIKPHELSGFTQCHFFAGIGGWSLALELAGWPATRPVWTGSCPCQPFSAAGQGKGQDDERHLWPVFASLIAACRPQRVFGEQVASAIGFGWLDGVCADMGAEGYTIGAAVLGAHSVGAPHIRQRLYWVADCESERRNWSAGMRGEDRWADFEADGADGGMGHATGGRRGIMRHEAQPWSSGHAIGSSWAGFEVVQCRDGKARRFEPGSFPLAHGIPGRVGLLRGYGNAIVPPVAAEFIKAFLEVTTDSQP